MKIKEGFYLSPCGAKRVRIDKIENSFIYFTFFNAPFLLGIPDSLEQDVFLKTFAQYKRLEE